MGFRKLKNIIKKIAPKFIILFYRNITSKTFKEEKRGYGSLNKDKKFYVIRRTPPAAGLMSNYSVVLLHLLEAEKRKLIPVIDYKNYNSYYKEENLINGTQNVWEYYWEQSSSYSLEEIYQSQNIILSAEIPNQEGIWNLKFLDNDIYIKKLYEISKKVPLNNKTQKYVNKVYEEVIPKNKNILGVAMRGTDYTLLKPQGHPVQPEIEEMIKIVKEKILKWKIDYIYLTTEEENTLRIFKNEFKNKLLFVKRERYKSYDGKKYIPDVRFKRSNDKYLTGLEYLSEMYILSKCNSLIAASNSGVVAAVIMNGNQYENKYIINLGVYN
ncbi:O-fucosyltransferase family protein [Fusobacterium ulcerans]|uniref:hypothetical protein n=1 Tax=Fusobacterium ulcerans TaxID=861 RepID=UPI001D0AD4AF|nr:hypothetical protein [Fusobacterium ulcerans]MCB8566646.1 hypothetical protein [Fusobacterium ulcerans]MCB8650860.1 hypothetical protein [Fusobacterium ulcerans]